MRVRYAPLVGVRMSEVDLKAGDVVADAPHQSTAHPDGQPAGRILRVALDTPADDCFDYLAVGNEAPGELVVVPFGKRQVVGVAVDRVDESEVPPDRLRPDRKSTRLNSSHTDISRMPSSA